MKYLLIMFINLFLVTGCSSAQWFSFPSKFTLCDVKVAYNTEKNGGTYFVSSAVGWCTPAKFLQKKVMYND